MKGINFCALDVETANCSRSSICQIGVVTVRDGAVIGGWETFVDPEDDFDDFNTGLHGIGPRDIVGAPQFPEALELVRQRIRDLPLVSHSSFDRTAFAQAAEEWDVAPLDVAWHDSLRFSRRFLPDIKGGYGLRNLADVLSLDLNHHNAVSDAKACAEVVLRCAEAASFTSFAELADTLPPVRVAAERDNADFVRFESDQEVESLGGETVLFTGELNQPRNVLTKLASKAGARVVSGASKKVTLLVVGVQDKQRTKGSAKSSKHRKVETLIKDGCDIRIVDERNFMAALS